MSETIIEASVISLLSWTHIKCVSCYLLFFCPDSDLGLLFTITWLNICCYCAHIASSTVNPSSGML